MNIQKAEKRFWKMATAVEAYAKKNNLEWNEIPNHVSISPAFFYFFGNFSYLFGVNPSLSGFSDAFISSKLEGYTFIDNSFLLETHKLHSEDLHKNIPLAFPFFAKPDGAYQGIFAEKIENRSELRSYFERSGLKYALIQELCDFDVEASLLFYRKPDGTLSFDHLVYKKYPEVLGNGKDSVKILILAQYPEKTAKKIISICSDSLLDSIPRINSSIILHKKGSMNYGSEFIYLKKDLSILEKQICKWLPSDSGVNYGRFDIKGQSIDDILQGKCKILELNGANAVPQQINNKNLTFKQRYSTLLLNCNRIQQASMCFGKTGINFIPFAIQNFIHMKFFMHKQSFYKSNFRQSTNTFDKVKRDFPFYKEAIYF